MRGVDVDVGKLELWESMNGLGFEMKNCETPKRTEVDQKMQDMFTWIATRDI
jgi:hypothetical protein